MALPAFGYPASTDPVLVYEVPDGKVAVVSINASAVDSCTVKIGITAGATAPATQNWIEQGRLLAKGGFVERTGIALPAKGRVYVQSDVANALTAQVYGLEENV